MSADTSPEIEKLVFERHMAMTAEERFIRGTLMFDVAREIILASKPAQLEGEELKRWLFHRIYGCSIEDVMAPTNDAESKT